MSISLALYPYVLFISLMQLMNGAQFLNITPLFLASACLAAVSFPANRYPTFDMYVCITIII